MTDLATWLLEQIGEDECDARSATEFNDAEWECPSTGVFSTGADGMDGLVPVSDRGMANHMARWDPARVLAECEAKRRIVEIHCAEPTDDGWLDPAWECALCGLFVKWPCETLKILSFPYRDRPGFREEWKVSDDG